MMQPSASKQPAASKQSITPQQVNAFHAKSDRDSSKTAQHHTLGIDANQGSSGDHNHDGRNSKLILDGVSLTGSRGGNAALVSVISALVQMGAIDNTTA